MPEVEGLPVDEAVNVPVEVGLCDPDTVADGVSVADDDGVRVEDGDGDDVSDDVNVGERVMERLTLGDAEGEGVAD